MYHEMLQYRFVEPVVVESDDAHDHHTHIKRRHCFTNERVVAMGEGSTVRFIWRGTSWTVERKYLARVIPD
jgi:hypothetical protein